MSNLPKQDYHRKKLELVLRDLASTPADEYARALIRLANVADESVLREAEFAALKAPAPAQDEREAFEAEYVMIGDGVGDVYDAMWHAFQNGAAWQRTSPAPTIRMPPAPYMPDVDPASMSDYERGEAQGRCDMWAMVKELNSAAPIAQPADGLVEALEHARLFIRNGVELGYIQMPDVDTPDPAHDTLPKIDAAIAAHRAQGERK